MSIMLGTLLPYIRSENSLSYAQSGIMLSGHQLGNLCAVLAAGILPYRIGRKNSTLLLFAGTAIGMVLMTLTGNPLLLVAAFIFTGIGRGTLSNICNVTISDISGNKAGALNVLHAIFATGALLSPLVVFLATRLPGPGWKYAALTAALLSFSAWILFLRGGLSNDTAVKDGGSTSFLKRGMFWLNTMILLFYMCAEASIVGWFVIYFEDVGTLPKGMAQFTPSILWIMIMIGRFSCAAISNRVDKNKLLIVLGTAFALFFTGMLLSRSPIPCIICLLGVGISMAGVYPTTFSTMEISSTVETGFVISLASLGGILMPGIVGAVADINGLAGGVAMVLTALFAMLVLMLVKLSLANRATENK